MVSAPAAGERRTWNAWVAWLALASGAIAVVLVVLPYKTFDLDRFFVPKELVLHASAAVAALALLARTRQVTLARVDQFLAAALVLSAASALVATNHWLAWRALAVSLSGAAVFWSARSVARAGLRDALLVALVAAVVAASVTAILQAYGWQSDLVSLNRAPGGTLGNRNFVAHLAAIGLPALVYLSLRASTRGATALGGVSVTLLAAVLAISRSRAAWLAAAACATIFALVAVGSWRRWRGTAAPRRSRVVVACAAGGVLAAIALPNRLNWKSDSPYLDSVRGVMNYREGSGRGRVVQYRTTLHMALTHPVLGVGPGNWAVHYPRYAASNDPSLNDSDGMTANPWPSSDWMADLSERGLIAFACLVLVAVGLGVSALLSMTDGAGDGAIAMGVTLLCTLVASAVVGAFDALLVLPAPAVIVWGLAGALSPPAAVRMTVSIDGPRRAALLVAVALLAAFAIGRSAAQARAMGLADSTTRLATLEDAASLDPGSYRIQIRIAEAYARRRRCDGVKPRAMRAHNLFPAAPEPRRLLSECGVRLR